MKYFLLTLLLCLFFLPALAIETDNFSVASYVLKAESNVKRGEFFKALENYQAAIDKGINSPDIHQQMSVLYYHLGFLAKAIKAAEEALNGAPINDYLHHHLGVLYFAKNNLAKAREHFIRALEINPGSTKSHYYLAHVFLRQDLPQLASLFAHSAQQLGHTASDIVKLLSDGSESSAVTVWSADKSRIYLRQIFIEDRQRSEEIMDRLNEGALFEDIARLESDSLNGGYSGGYPYADLKSEIVSSFSNTAIPSMPIVIESGKGFTIVQKIAPIDWERITPRYHSQSAESLQVELQELTAAGSVDSPNDFLYTIQVGAFREYVYAQHEIEKINALGYEGYMVKTFKGDKPFYVVFAGHYPNSSLAEKVHSIFKDKGFDSLIIKRKVSP